MRIISGKHRGRIIEFVPSDSTRETQDKIRGAIFNSIYPYTEEKSTCLDLFAGSGAMALEAYSRGIEDIYLNDLASIAIKTIKNNLNALKIENYHLYNYDYKKCLEELKTNKFDIIFLDPPYKMNVIDEIIDYILDNNMLNNDGLIVAEYENSVENHGLKVIKEKSYGYKKVKIFLKEEE